MVLASFGSNAQEYEARRQREFVAPSVTLKELRQAVPKEAFRKSTTKGVCYVIRTVVMAYAFYKLATYVDPFAASLSVHPVVASIVRWILWIVYWFFQSLAWGGLWTLGHEAGHGLLSPHQWVNHILGFTVHTFLLVPYFAWRWTHHVHHKASASLERDENYVPRTRSDLKLPKAESATKFDYHEIFEEAPIYTLGKLAFMTLLGFQVYMGFNAMGSPAYPPGTNHLDPWSPLFKPEHWHHIMYSNVGLSFMFGILTIWTRQNGLAALVKYYLIPYLLANHWVVILTFLQHSDPTIPHYRKGQWNFVRGALATVDRPLLGWAGRFFLHNIAHDHTAHHLFSNIPFYNLPLVTEAIIPILKDHYSYDSTYTFHALWRSFTECLFVEDEGDILFYMNKNGEAARRVGSSEARQDQDEDTPCATETKLAEEHIDTAPTPATPWVWSDRTDRSLRKNPERRRVERLVRRTNNFMIRMPVTL